MNLIAVKQVKYKNVTYKPGDRFRATAEDARLLKGWAKAIDDPKTGAIETRQETAIEEEPQKPRNARRGKYDRRDMRAQE